jgi:putative endonuclease
MVSFRHREEPLQRSNPGAASRAPWVASPSARNDGIRVVISSEAKQPRSSASHRLGCFVSLTVTSQEVGGAMRNGRAPTVYILASQRNGTPYTGVTSDLRRRVSEHREALKPGFTAKYAVNRLVYFETFEDMVLAIAREKQMKGGSRSKKLKLIEGSNPQCERSEAARRARKAAPKLLRFARNNDGIARLMVNVGI